MSKQKGWRAHPLAPQWWPTWVGLGFFRALIVLLPMRWALAFGAALGRLAGRVLPSRMAIVRTNLQLCFPTLNEAEREALARAHFAAVGRGVMEAAEAWWGRDAELEGHTRLEGLAHLEAARAKGKGVILLLAHFTTLEMCGWILQRHISDLNVVYKPTHNQAVERQMAGIRSAHLGGLIASRDFRGIVRALRAQRVLWYVPDQDFGRRGTVFAPFMGVPAATLAMTSRLAQHTGAAVLPVQSLREGNSDWVVRIEPPLADFPSGDEVADATAINAVIARHVEAAPEQYFWVHRRFKTRPDPSEPSPYQAL